MRNQSNQNSPIQLKFARQRLTKQILNDILGLANEIFILNANPSTV